jgi:hypothetical protein
MHPEMRARFNADFTPDKYAALVHCVNTMERWPADFRMSETPIFLTQEFSEEVQRAAHKIVNLLQTPEFVRHSKDSVPSGWEVPNESAHPNFLVVDFGICSEGDRLVPRLIELQAFPSLYGFQLMMLDCLRKSYPAVPRNWTSSFRGVKDEQYLELLRKTILGTVDPKQVVLLEIEPEKQKTRVDFAATETLLGIETVSLTEIKKRDRTLLYSRNGTDIPIQRIYNRVIFDELMRRPDLTVPFRFQDDLDVKWVGHPNWYFRISKHSLPFLKTEHTSAAFFVDEFPATEDVSAYVLKPLFSFAGLGVDMEPTPEKLKKLPRPREWILQKKVAYADFVPTPHGPRSKAEIRMMFLWPEEDEAPVLVNNLVRMSQGKMMGVDFNKEKTWVGSSIALHDD